MSAVRYRYADLTPPGPMVLVTVRCPVRGVFAEQRPALLDSGADRTVIPGNLVAALELCRTGTITVQGFASGIIELPLSLVEILVADKPPIRIQVVQGAGEPFILLGRDVLNQFKIVLDGPQQSLSIE